MTHGPLGPDSARVQGSIWAAVPHVHHINALPPRVWGTALYV